MNGGTKAVAELTAGGSSGEFEALISTYGEVDSYRQRINSSESFERIAGAINSGDVVIPVVWQHVIHDPNLYVGEVKEADVQRVGKHGKTGLGVAGAFDMDEPTAAKAFRNVKSGRVPNWSYRWTGTATKAADGVDDLSNMWIHEVSPVLEGAQTSTHTLGVKAYSPADMRREVDRLLSGVRELVPAGLAGLKSYVDLDVPGSFEAVQEAICDALRAKYPPSTDPSEIGPYASIVATLPDRVAFQITGGPDDDSIMWAPYTIGSDGTAELGDATPATVSLSGASSSSVGPDGELEDPALDHKAPATVTSALLEVERVAPAVL